MTKVRILAAALATAWLMTGCIRHHVATFVPLPFDEAEYASLPTTGTGTVRGQVFAKTVGGDVVFGAGNNVVMIPATAYGTQRYREQVIAGKLLSQPEDPRFAKYVKSTVADGEGRFTFQNVPPGRYYVFSHVTWEAYATNRYVTDTQGGRVSREIEVQDDQETAAILTR